MFYTIKLLIITIKLFLFDHKKIGYEADLIGF